MRNNNKAIPFKHVTMFNANVPNSYSSNITIALSKRLGKPQYRLYITQKVRTNPIEVVKWSLRAHEKTINKRSLNKIDHLFQELTLSNDHNKTLYLKLNISSNNQLLIASFKQHLKLLQTHLSEFKKLENRYKIHNSLILALNLILSISKNYTKFLINLALNNIIERKSVKKELKSFDDQY